MLGEHHDLHHEFPEHKDAIHHLKMNNTHFKRLFTDYHSLTHEIESVEMNNNNSFDERLKEMKIKRLGLKDSMLQMIVQDH